MSVRSVLKLSIEFEMPLKPIIVLIGTGKDKVFKFSAAVMCAALLSKLKNLNLTVLLTDTSIKKRIVRNLKNGLKKSLNSNFHDV